MPDPDPSEEAAVVKFLNEKVRQRKEAAEETAEEEDKEEREEEADVRIAVEVDGSRMSGESDFFGGQDLGSSLTLSFVIDDAFDGGGGGGGRGVGGGGRARGVEKGVLSMIIDGEFEGRGREFDAVADAPMISSVEIVRDSLGRAPMIEYDGDDDDDDDDDLNGDDVGRVHGDKTKIQEKGRNTRLGKQLKHQGLPLRGRAWCGGRSLRCRS